MKMKPFSLLLLSLASLPALAQTEVGLFGGLSSYQGDLTEKPFALSKPAAGITLGFPVSQRFTVRAGLTFAKVAGADSLHEKDYLRERNLSFQSPLTELMVRGEYHLFNLENIRWTPYIFAGIAAYRFNPYTNDERGNRVYLKPLTTEGQGLPGYTTKPYSLTQVALPFGGGFRFAISDRTRLGMEMGFRKLFTDYLDDVSTNYAAADDLLAAHGQRAVDIAYRADEAGGNPVYPAKGAQRGGAEQKDWYYFTGLHLTISLGEGGRGMGRRGGYGCPEVPR